MKAIVMCAVRISAATLVLFLAVNLTKPSGLAGDDYNCKRSSSTKLCITIESEEGFEGYECETPGDECWTCVEAHQYICGRDGMGDHMGYRDPDPN